MKLLRKQTESDWSETLLMRNVGLLESLSAPIILLRWITAALSVQEANFPHPTRDGGASEPRARFPPPALASVLLKAPVQVEFPSSVH